MPDPFRRQPNGGPMRGPTPRTNPGPRPANPPPGGAAGASQQTTATQYGTFLFAPGYGRAATRPSGKKRRRKAKRARKRKTKTARRAGRKGAKFVKGSAAAKRHMAKLRRMQKRRRA